ncbi:MAG: hypothetical protein PHG23_03575 [Candidatus Pacebacteria bacterium]|nr:hypothetical protein [Candidatus Paceibacterota bacterium]
MSTSITDITDGQRKQIKRFAEDAVDCAIAEGFFDKKDVQRIIENGDVFKARVAAAMKNLSISDDFIDEEVKSNYRYPFDYKIKGIGEQVNILRRFFPNLGLALEKIEQQPLPPNAEGWFAIPRWQAVGKTYEEALREVFNLLAEQHDGKLNKYGFEIGEKHLRQQERTERSLRIIGGQQVGFDILIVPAQFGLCHKGRSVRRARKVFSENEFGLGVFEIGCMLLTHPERLSFENLWVICAGSEYALRDDGIFTNVPSFILDCCWIEIRILRAKTAVDYYGSATAFVPPNWFLPSALGGG